MIHELAQTLVNQISDWGYFGIFIMMAIESSFIPFPSEIILVPAGYLASQHEMNIVLIILFSISGSIIGASINYYLALKLGRPFLEKYGRYFFIKQEALDKMDLFFCKHGHISTFTGRLIPGIRQLISIPAGLARMNLVKFYSFTILGSGIWSLILIFLGYFIGKNQALINIYLKEITSGVFVLLIIIGFVYYKYQKARK